MDQIICGQWSVETKTQWNRDTSHWKDDASRPRNTTSGRQVIALLREAALRLYNKEAFECLNTGTITTPNPARPTPPQISRAANQLR